MSADAVQEGPGGAGRSVARAILALFLVATVLGLLGLAHLYLVQRLVLAPEVPAPWRSVAIAVVAVLGVGMLLQPPLERLLPPRLARPLSWPPLLWMGVFFVALNATLLSDLATWLLGASLPLDASPRSVARVQAAAVVLGTAALSLIGLPAALRVPAVRRVRVELERWPAALDGFRIVQISDIHIGPILGRGFASGLVERVNALAPDLIAVTGDLVDGREAHLRDDVAPFADLEATHGVYFVTGNHDFYSGADAWVARAAELGMRVLRNERVRISTGDGSFDLAGVDDYRGDWRLGSSQDLPAALEGRDEFRALVLLAHDPTTFHEASRAGVDLQLSGHTHGGQIWPFRYLVRLAVPFVAGLYERGRSTLYVSRGTGFWGPPIRLLAPAEITELVLCCPSESPV